MTAVRHVASGTPLRAGDLVYCVVEVDPPPDVDGPHTWKAAAVVVERASAKQIKLRSAFPGQPRTAFHPDAFGSIFFETPLQAIHAFLWARRIEIESIERKRKEAERAIAWAKSQEGIAP